MGARLILVGRVTGAFGVRGEVKIAAFTEDPLALLGYSPLLDARGAPALTLLTARPDKAGVIGRAREVATREEAEARRGQDLYIEREALPAPAEDEFYLADLIGLEAESPQGDALGRVRSVQNFGAGDLLEIEPVGGGASWWAPFSREVVPEVLPAERRIVIDRPDEIEG